MIVRRPVFPDAHLSRVVFRARIPCRRCGSHDAWQTQWVTRAGRWGHEMGCWECNPPGPRTRLARVTDFPPDAGAPEPAADAAVAAPTDDAIVRAVVEPTNGTLLDVRVADEPPADAAKDQT